MGLLLTIWTIEMFAMVQLKINVHYNIEAATVPHITPNTNIHPKTKALRRSLLIMFINRSILSNEAIYYQYVKMHTLVMSNSSL